MKNKNLPGVPAGHRHSSTLTKSFMAVLFLLLLAGCDVQQEAKVLATANDTKRVWVFIQVNVPGKDKVEDYYYYGRVSANLYKQISENRVTRGFILLNDVVYFGDDEKYHRYEDDEDSGTMVFRVEDIRRLNLIKKSPMADNDKRSQSSSDGASTPTESSASGPVVKSSYAATAEK